MKTLSSLSFHLGMLCLGLFLLSSCDGNRTQRWQDTVQLKWERKQEIKNNITIDDPAIPYEISLGLRHLDDIPYPTVDVELLITSPSDQITQRNYTLNIRKESGELIGEVMAQIVDLEQVVEPSYSFSEKGEYNFTIRHKMTDEILVGIMEVGLILLKK